MQFAKYLVGVGVFLGLSFGVLSVTLAAATKPMVMPETKAMLSVDSNRVELKRADNANWMVVTEDTEVHVGDTIWTDTPGSATLTFFDQGVLRLDGDTTLVIEQADIDPEHPEIFHGQVFMESGQLWSRMFDFLSPESSYEVRTASTVATVRGTIFSVWQRGEMSGVYVDEHQVHVTNDGEDMMVEQGDFLMMDPAADNLMNVHMNMKDEMQTWVKTNRQRDASFDVDMLNSMKTYVPTIQTDLTLAERLRLALSFKKSELRARFETRQRMSERMEMLKQTSHTESADPTPNTATSPSAPVAATSAPTTMPASTSQLVLISEATDTYFTYQLADWLHVGGLGEIDKDKHTQKITNTKNVTVHVLCMNEQCPMVTNDGYTALSWQQYLDARGACQTNPERDTKSCPYYTIGLFDLFDMTVDTNGALLLKERYTP